MSQLAVIEAVGIAEQFKFTELLIDKHRAGSGERMEGRALRTSLTLYILRLEIIPCRPRRAVGMGVPDGNSERFAIDRHLICVLLDCTLSDVRNEGV